MGEYISKYPTGVAVDNALDAGLAASAEVVNARGGFESLSARLAALEYEDIAITSFTVSPSICELGSSNTISLAWSLNKAATQQTINGTPVTGNSKAFTSVTTNTTYQLDVADDQASATKNVSVDFANQIYFGAASDLTTVTQLDKVLSNTKTRTITVDAGTSEYIVYAYPSRLGDVTFYVSGFEGGFESPIEQFLANASGYHESYKIYRSANSGLGLTTVEIKEG